MKRNAFSSSIFVVAFVSVVASILIASSNPENVQGWPFLGSYFYWIARIIVESAMFVLAYEFIERILGARWGVWSKIMLATAATHIPFVLSVTAFDIVLGLPELGIGAATEDGSSRLTAFGLELLYLADNHIALCLLLSIPKLIGLLSAPDTEDNKPIVSLLASLSPPLRGEVFWVEAQEHYVRVTTSDEKRMVLNRFSDVVNDLAAADGLQVHRSHWIALNAVKDVTQKGQTMELLLTTGDSVPVSRSYRKATESALEASNLVAS